MCKLVLLSALSFFICQNEAIGQGHTLGLLSYDHAKSQDGYNLFFPARQSTVWLTNNCGEVVHSWPDIIWQPGEAVYIHEDGTLWAAKGQDMLSNPLIHSGGGGEKVEHRDWDNTLLWTFTYNSPEVRMHHDFTVLPNGNVLLIAWELKGKAACLAAGRDTNKLSEERLFPDHLVEVEPLGPDSGIIVWEWHVWDHLIQDFDSTKANYGVVSNHPERVDLNYCPMGTFADWTHMNTVRYHPGYDLIMLSVPTFDEVWIIDHSTTTAEAAGSTGGRFGKGGDLVYRWGNPMAYGRGDSTDKKLGFQHTSYWLSLTKDESDPDHNRVLLFNNRMPDSLSSVGSFVLPLDTNTWTFGMAGGTYLPADFDWVYMTPVRARMNSAVMSNAQRLPNGNTLICACRNGYALEIDTLENIVWEYIIPFYMGSPASQGTVLPPSANLTFRLERYTPDFPAFVGKDLSPKGYLELDPDTTFCDSLLLAEWISSEKTRIDIFPNPTSSMLSIELARPLHQPAALTLTDCLGQVVLTDKIWDSKQIDLSGMPSGTYLLSIGSHFRKRVVVVR